MNVKLNKIIVSKNEKKAKKSLSRNYFFFGGKDGEGNPESHYEWCLSHLKVFRWQWLRTNCHTHTHEAQFIHRSFISARTRLIEPSKISITKPTQTICHICRHGHPRRNTFIGILPYAVLPHVAILTDTIHQTYARSL